MDGSNDVKINIGGVEWADVLIEVDRVTDWLYKNMKRHEVSAKKKPKHEARDLSDLNTQAKLPHIWPWFTSPELSFGSSDS